MPAEFIKCSGKKLIKSREYISSWAFTRYYFKRNLDKNVKYGDAFIFKKINANKYKEIWNSKDNVIFVHNDKKYAEAFSELYDKNTFFIKIPSKNAYDDYENIKKEILLKARDKENLIILVSAGSCGKVLVNDLSQKGYQCIDTGHCFDSPLKGISM